MVIQRTDLLTVPNPPTHSTVILNVNWRNIKRTHPSDAWSAIGNILLYSTLSSSLRDKVIQSALIKGRLTEISDGIKSVFTEPGMEEARK